MIAQWDEVESERGEKGHIAGSWRSLTGSSSVSVGVTRIQVDPGMWSTPLHLEGADEEIFYVLGGSGTSVQRVRGEMSAHDVRAGDCLVHRALENAHTLKAGTDGIDVLAFGERNLAGGVTWLPRAGVAWLGSTWASVGEEEGHPWTREAAAGPPEVSELSPRPPNIVNVDDVEAVERDGQTVARRVRDLGRAAGSVRTGLRHAEVPPGKLNAAPHCHSVEEEIFVVLDGDGALVLWESEGVVEYPVIAGSVVTRLPGTGVAHSFRGGDRGMTLLMYGTRNPSDVCFYPRSHKVFFTGLGLITRVGETIDYWEGED
ncbi:MAG TPA: hypothetical protein VI540_10395 [Gaiellaceae bacterium]|nr:hypothetical protein [Gaiellaceae bacterium]